MLKIKQELHNCLILKNFNDYVSYFLTLIYQ